MGVVLGMLVIDAGFDIVVLSDQALQLDGVAPLDARRLAGWDNPTYPVLSPAPPRRDRGAEVESVRQLPFRI